MVEAKTKVHRYSVKKGRRSKASKVKPRKAKMAKRRVRRSA
jgi:hypothetical protein